MLKGILVMSCIRPCVQLFHGLGFVHCRQIAWKKWPTNWHAHVSRWLMLSCHWQLWVLLPIIIVSIWLSVGVFICWVWFGEGKGDILVLMCYILHNSAYPFCKSVIVTEIIVYEFCMYGNKLHHLHVRGTWHILQWPRCNIYVIFRH